LNLPGTNSYKKEERKIQTFVVPNKTSTNTFVGDVEKKMRQKGEGGERTFSRRCMSA